MIGQQVDGTWPRRAALGVFGAWALLSVVRLSRLVEPAAMPPGGDLQAVVDFFRANIPTDAGVLFVLPGAFGTDTGTGPRLRYELYPRVYDDIRASEDEDSIRRLMQSEGLGYIVVPDASAYASDSWLRQNRDWLRRIALDANRYLLEVVT